MKIAISILFVNIFILANAQNVSIPDVNFKSYLVNRPDINTNNDSEIQVTEASAFTDSIICFSQGINNMTGIEAFTNVSFLNIAFNSVSSIDLSQNAELKAFICPFNNLSTLDVSNNLLLEQLVFWDNNVSAIDVTMLPQLKRLEFNSNSISSLDITQNPLLETLFASGNMIGNIDFTIFPNLMNLELNGCAMTSVDFTNNPQLTSLQLMINDVTSLDFSQNPLLEYMRCDFNEMVTLDMSMCPNLTTFGCFSCDNLEFLNMQNGNNTIMMNFQANNNPNLTCIQVDDVAYSASSWGTVDDSNIFSVDCSLTSLNEKELNSVNCYPNPVTDYFTIDSEATIAKVQLYSELGNLVFEERPNAMNVSLKVDALAQGVYVVNVTFETGQTVIERMVK